MLFDDVHIVDLNQIPAEKLTKAYKTGMMRLLMKYGRTQKFYNQLKALVEQNKLSLLLSSYDDDYLYAVITYTTDMLSTGKYSAQDVINLYAEALPQAKDKIMTITQQLRQEGRQEGILLGRQEGIFVTACSMLAKGMDLSLIKELTGLTADQIKALP